MKMKLVRLCCRPQAAIQMIKYASVWAHWAKGDLGIAPSTVSHHLKELCRAGLTKMKERGQAIEWWVDSRTLDSLAAFFKHPVHV